MAITWTPDNVSPILTVTKPAATVATASATTTVGDTPTYEVLSNDCPASITVVATSVDITVGGNSSSSFPPNFIRYLKNIITMTWAAGVVTVTTSGAHGVVNGVSRTISGVTPAGYNGTFTITVTGVNSFTYPLAVNPGLVTIQGTFLGEVYDPLLVPANADPYAYSSNTTLTATYAFTARVTFLNTGIEPSTSDITYQVVINNNRDADKAAVISLMARYA